nr:glutamate receptor-like [Procambarus clarkii]
MKDTVEAAALWWAGVVVGEGPTPLGMAAGPVPAAHQQESLYTDNGGGRRGRGESWWWQEARDGTARALKNGNIFKFRFPRAPRLRVAVEEWLPYTKVNWRERKGVPRVTGPSKKLLDLAATALNFQYTFVRGDGYFGIVQKDGSWNGMMGMLRRNEADIALGPIGMSLHRSRVVDFTFPLGQESYRIMTARPQLLPDSWTMVAPFTWPVWVSLVLSLLGMWGASWTVARFTYKFQGPRAPGDHLFNVYAILVSQGLTWQPRGTAIRITCLTWMFVSLIFTSYFKSSFSSLLTVKSLPATVDSLEDLLNDQSLALFLEGNTSFVSLVQNATSGAFEKLARELRHRGKFFANLQLAEFVRDHLTSDHNAALLEENTIKKFMAKDLANTGRCNFYLSKDSLYSMFVALAFPKGSPLLQLFNARVLTLRENGLYDHWVGQEIYGAAHCYCAEHRVVEMAPHTLVDLKIAFGVLLVGSGLAALILLWDILYSRFREKGIQHLVLISLLVPGTI